MIHQLKYALRHRFKSFYLHGIHSPFIFDLQQDCIQDRRYYKRYDELLRFRESVINNNTLLTIEDHGAGSKIFKSNQRKVSDILRHNSSNLKTAKLLYRMAAYFKANRILELGTSIGVATHALAIARPTAQITTVEGSLAVHETAQKQLKSHNINNVNCVHATFNDFLDQNHTETYDLIYLDGHHDGMATITYFETLLKHSHNDTVFILDDIYWSRDMTDAWQELCHHPQVTASIDLYDIGILFLRKEQLQERFYMRC